MKGIGIRLLWVAVGIAIGILVVVAGRLWQEPPTLVSAERFLDTDVNDLISIYNEADAVARRKDLITFIWGPNGLPVELPEKIDTDIDDQRYSGLSNVKQINRLTIPMEWGLISTAYHFIPHQGNRKLLIYHRGHDGDFVGGIDII